MLEPDDPTQQSQAGPSRLTREIVPTSDDEDFFFISQSSAKYGSSLDSAQGSRQGKESNDDDDEEEDEDEDDEALLPARHDPPSRQESQQLTLISDHSHESSRQDRLIEPEAPTKVPTSTWAVSRSIPPSSQTSNERRPLTSPSSATTMLHSIITPLSARVDADHKDAPPSLHSTPPRPTDDNRDNVEEQSTSQREDSLAPMSPAEITLIPSASQQSVATLPYAESPTASNDIALTPFLALEESAATGSTSPLDASSRQSIEQSEVRPSMDLDLDLNDDGDSAGQARGEAPASDTLDQHASPARLPSSPPSPPPLRIPPRGDAPRAPPPAPREAPPIEPQGNKAAILDDEQLARAAAAQPPTPPRRQLRARNAAQLNPYTLEAVRYQRALIRNDWEDAVVSQREWHRQERKRIAEEAAKAQREAQAAQGSEESQSQWLVPSSGPSSQADHEEPSVPSSPAVSSTPQVFVDIPVLDDTGSLRAHASGSRPRPSSPTPSQSGRLPELSEMLAKSSKTASLHPNRNKPGPAARPATYKGPRTIASTDANPAPQPALADEDEATPLPPPVRRKHPLRALSPSDGEGSIDVNQPTLPNQDTFIIESSEDERPATVVAKPKRRSRWSGDGSSSDSTDYERRFRQLKKMMPAGMARKHIRDLRAMRHGKAYHSDGHVSSSSADADTNKGTNRRDADRPRARPTDTAHTSDNEDLQPGQTRKRLRRHDSLDANNALLLDPDSDSSSSSSSASSLSSGASVSFTHSTLAEPFTDVDPQSRHKEAEEADETPAPWWSVNRLDSYVPYRERDAIDRMLSRTGGGKPSSKTAVRRSNGTSHRQARLDGFVSAHRHRGSNSNSSRSHLREIDQNQRRQQRTTVEKGAGHLHSSRRKKKKKRPKLDPRVGRTTTSSRPGGPVQLRNPPVVRPRARPRLDLEQHDVLFAANPTKTRRAGWHADEGPDEDDISDDDGQWQVLSSVVRDSTPASLPDARLAVPRRRAGGDLPRGAPSARMEGDAAPSPVRGPFASPSVSSASARPIRTNAINDHSPGTPSRARWDAVPAKAQVRSNAGQTMVPLSIASDQDGSYAWDDFEGISLDFGMTPFAEGKRLEVTGSSLLARLPDLIALPDRLLGQEHIPRTWSGEVLRLEDTVLEADMDHEMLVSKLPFFVDNLRLTISRTLGDHENGSDADARRHVRNLVADTGAFLGCWMVRQAQGAAERLTDPASIFRTYRTILERIEQLQASALSLHEPTRSAKDARGDRKSICLQLAWMRFELCWRAMAICDADANNALEPEAPTVESLLAYSRTLMALLLHQGLHRSIRNLRKAAEGGPSSAGLGNAAADMDHDEETTVYVDEATAMWLGVIHLLGSFEKSRGIKDGKLFWTQFETTYQRWDESMPKRAPLLRAESLWYCLFALSTLSQVSPDGETMAASSLRGYWPLVARALLFVQFRSDESKEMAMGWHMLAKRDAYVRIVLQRCCLLASEWRWSMDGAEVTLARLFDIFNSHKLADLPTETEHDFPAFLRDFDVRKLSTADVVDGEAMQDPSFHLFVRILAQAGQELGKHAIEAKEGDRRISRLFSRMTPVRVMPFTRTDVPTSSQRSVLFNHYTVVILFLHLVPTSSPQRLRQIQSFLPAFKDADFVSQVTCIRAMMYVAVIFRHHRLDLDPVIKWFGDTIAALRREYEEIDSSTKRYECQQLQHALQHRNAINAPGRPDAVRMADIFENAPARQAALRRKEEVARLLVVALRSIQHVIRHADIQGEASGTATAGQRLPDQLLLSPAWTQQMLEAQISLEPRVGQEVLKCIQTFLLARIRVLQPEATRVNSAIPAEEDQQQQRTVAQQRDEESQDSFAELFEADDDFDFEDPLLARLLDGADSSTAIDGGGVAGGGVDGQREADKAHAEKKKWDREFGELVKNTISPSLFQLLSNIYHPDRRMEAAATGSVVMSLGVTQRLNELPMDADSSSAGRVSTARTRMDRLLKAAEARQYLELVVDCWAGCAHVLVTNGLREWSSYLGFGNESWKRIDDAVGRRDVGLRFLQNVVSLDRAAVVARREYEVEFLAVWIQTAVARVLSVQDMYTRSLIEAGLEAKRIKTASLLSTLAEQWQVVVGAGSTSSSPTTARDELAVFSLDLDSFTTHRTALLRTTYTTLASALASTSTSTGTAYSILSALLSALRAYVEDTPIGEAAQSSNTLDYLRFCKTTLSDVEVALGGTQVLTSLRTEYAAAAQAVNARLSSVGSLIEQHSG